MALGGGKEQVGLRIDQQQNNGSWLVKTWYSLQIDWLKKQNIREETSILKVKQWALVNDRETKKHGIHFHKLFKKGSHKRKVRLRCVNSPRNYTYFEKN